MTAFTPSEMGEAGATGAGWSDHLRTDGDAHGVAPMEEDTPGPAPAGPAPPANAGGGSPAPAPQQQGQQQGQQRLPLVVAATPHPQALLLRAGSSRRSVSLPWATCAEGLDLALVPDAAFIHPRLLFGDSSSLLPPAEVRLAAARETALVDNRQPADASAVRGASCAASAAAAAVTVELGNDGDAEASAAGGGGCRRTKVQQADDAPFAAAQAGEPGRRSNMGAAGLELFGWRNEQPHTAAAAM